MVIIGTWLATASIITALAMKVNKMIASSGSQPVGKIQATVVRMKLLSKINNLTGLVAMLLAVSLRM